jgi:HSP20 family protein
MSLIKWQPLEDLHSLRNQINRLFDDIVHQEPLLDKLSLMKETAWVPAVELQETDTELVLKAQVPGIEQDKLDVQVSDTAVFLAGEYQSEKKTDEKGMVRSEFHYGEFKRVIPLPSAIDREKVKAEMTDGLLTLTMLKVTPAVPNVVKVPLTTAAKTTAEPAAK